MRIFSRFCLFDKRRGSYLKDAPAAVFKLSAICFLSQFDAMDGNSAGQPQRGALFGPWPCHSDGTSTVPPLDRVQVNKIRSHLSQIFVAETHDCHLVQAIREQLLPSQIYQLIHASADSITWDVKPLIEPVWPSAPQTTALPTPTSTPPYGEAANNEWGPPKGPWLSPSPSPWLDALQSGLPARSQP